MANIEKNSPTPPWLSDGWKHIWHPYTQMQTAELPHPVVGAESMYIHLADGTKLLDGIASWWSMCHGYQHPHLVQAVQTQAAQLSHVMFAGLAHEGAYRLAARLAAITPGDLNRVFFSDSGSTAIEVAMKMAVQYWRNKDKPAKYKFLSFRHAYHGDTMGAMSLSDVENGMHAGFVKYMPQQYRWDIPSSELEFSELESLLKDEGKNIAAMVIEPLVQCAGGFHFYSADILAALHKLARQYDVLFIADEIATGFYRTGYRFSCEEAGIVPDILCLGKALTGGMVSLGATCVRDEVYSGFLSDSLQQALMHGPTFMANPLACAAANASLDVFDQQDYSEKVEFIEQYFYQRLKEFSDLPGVASTHVKGAIGVVEFKETNWEYIFALRKTLVKEGVWLRPFGNVLYFMPPLIAEEKHLDKLVNAALKAVRR